MFISLMGGKREGTTAATSVALFDALGEGLDVAQREKRPASDLNREFLAEQAFQACALPGYANWA
jgi:hypothetical protein